MSFPASLFSSVRLPGQQPYRQNPSLIVKIRYQSYDNMATHRADASALLDNRGYTGPLVRGVNPATLFEKAVRDRITDSYYWKEQCFGLNAATLCDRAVELGYIVNSLVMVANPPWRNV
uniref:Pre-mRNA-splicing factor 38 n=1 Tax=Coccidioides posadasii RMSCC 3488 TaxID=454284 RepID=A0A0J6FEQ9_COCPO|nr:hypothetical protein CPAG_04068 [Coccidioides posadasii RMSCC 3488]